MLDEALDITSKVSKFNELKAKNENNNTRFMKKLYREIREWCLTQAYCSRYIRSKITDEDMPDFIIYLDEKLLSIIKAFNPQKDSSFETLYRKSLDYRARNYMDTRRRHEKRERAYVNYYIPFEEENERNCISNPYDDVLERLSKGDRKQKTDNNDSLKKLKYILANRNAMRRNFYIFLASELPFLPMDKIEHICKELNYDFPETKAIEKYLATTTKTTEKNMESAFSTVNRFKSLILTTQAEIYLNGDCCTKEQREKLDKALAFQTMKRKAAMDRLATTSTCVKNPVLANLFNIPLGTVSSSINKGKNMLSFILNEQPEDSKFSMGKLDDIDSVYEKPYSLKPFKPSEVFKLTAI